MASLCFTQTRPLKITLPQTLGNPEAICPPSRDGKLFATRTASNDLRLFLPPGLDKVRSRMGQTTLRLGLRFTLISRGKGDHFLSALCDVTPQTICSEIDPIKKACCEAGCMWSWLTFFPNAPLGTCTKTRRKHWIAAWFVRSGRSSVCFSEAGKGVIGLEKIGSGFS